MANACDKMAYAFILANAYSYMNAPTTEILILILLILINGFFSLAEMAIVSSRKVRLQQRAEEGSKGAETALVLARQPTRFLSTVQTGKLCKDHSFFPLQKMDKTHCITGCPVVD